MSKNFFTLRSAAISVTALALTACLSGGGGGGKVATPDTPAKATGPAVKITNPNAPAIETTDEFMTLEGTAESNAELVSVAWDNDRAGNGVASGTASWVAENVPLEIGNNTITVTMRDAAGKTATDTIAIKRQSVGTGSVTLSWMPPTERSDGTPLKDLAGYTIHYGRLSEIYDFEIIIDNAGITTYVVENLAPGGWYFAISAFDVEGNSSDLSEEIYVEIQ